jgi:hypothetical protein
VLKIKPDVEVVKQDIVFERAPILTVRIQGADGGPLRGVWVGGSSPQDWHSPPTVHCKEADCTVYEIEPGKPRLLVFYHAERKLFGTLTLKRDEIAPVVAKFGPAGSIEGRLLDAEGKPLAGMVVDVHYQQKATSEIHKIVPKAKQVVTDATGAFTLADLIPEQKFVLSFSHGKRKFERRTKPTDAMILVKPGECRNLGAIELRPIPEKPPE